MSIECKSENKLEMKSQFLFGPRAIGKTSYISHELFQNIVLRWNLLNTRLRRKAETAPGLLYKEVVDKLAGPEDFL